MVIIVQNIAVSPRNDCCSIPYLGFNTLEKWRTFFNDDCCKHDDLYNQGWTVHNEVVIKARNRRFADDWWHNLMIQRAQEYEDRYGVFAFHAAYDMHKAVRRFGWRPWRLKTFKRWRNRNGYAKSDSSVT